MTSIRHLTDRLWIYGKGGWDGRWPSLGSDEYGRRTLVLPLPRERALVWAYWTCRCSDCDDARTQAEQAESETLCVMAFHGIDRDAAYEMSGDDWNRALVASRG